MDIKNTVIIITYNQEKLIGRALDSLLCQKEFIYEIVICDDCSTDNNWEVIQNYYKQFPDIIKPYRNAQNLGIFGNIENTWTKANGNVIWYLSGDDAYCNSVFMRANDMIQKNNLNPESDYFSLYFDFERVYPNGRHKRHSNKKIIKHEAVSLKIRNIIYGRTVGFSKNIYNNFFPVRKDIGIFADGLIDIQIQLFSKINLYCSFVGSYYYTDIGIGSKTDKTEGLQSFLLSIKEYFNVINNLNKKDQIYLKYLIYKSEFELNPSIKKMNLLVLYYFKSISIKYGFNFFIKHTIRCVVTIINGLIK